MAVVRTAQRRPDLLAARGGITEQERRLLDEFGLPYPEPFPAAPVQE
jgi:hypothetical protein